MPFENVGDDNGDTYRLELSCAKLESALRECVKSLCEYVDNDSPGKTNERKANAQKVVARVFEVLGDA